MSVTDLNRLLVIALYLPVCLLVYKRLFPRLSRTSKLLATFFLAAQVLVIWLSLTFQFRPGAAGWLWHLDKEYNIPATLASTQLATIGFVALITAWLSRRQVLWRRLFYAGIGVIFIHLARDEFFVLHEVGMGWQISFAQFGAATALATALSTVRLSRSLRIWHVCILAGLALGATGALAVDAIQSNGQCVSTVFFTEHCEIYVLEETLELLGMWLALVGMLGLFSAAPSQSRRWQLVVLLPALWVAIHSNPYLVRLAEYVAAESPATIRYQSHVDLTISRLNHDQDQVALNLFALAKAWRHYKGVGYSLHLVDQVSGASYASIDVGGHRRHTVAYRLVGRSLLYKQRLALAIPPSTPRDRALWLVLTMWREQDAEFTRQQIEASEFPLLDDDQVILNELVLKDVKGPSSSDPIAFFEPGISLEGADFPERGQAGASLLFRFDWRSDEAVEEDYIQFLHFGHEASGDWLVFDQPPLGPRLPTRLWYSGMVDSEVWQVSLPEDLAPGQYALYTGLYRISDLERMHASTVDGTPFIDNRIPLGSLTINASG